MGGGEGWPVFVSRMPQSVPCAVSPLRTTERAGSHRAVLSYSRQSASNHDRLVEITLSYCAPCLKQETALLGVYNRPNNGTDSASQRSLDADIRTRIGFISFAGYFSTFAASSKPERGIHLITYSTRCLM